MANYRTRTAQQSLVRREKKATDFFRQGQENEGAQQAQHDILVKFAETGRKGSITPIVDVLETEGQTQPILITSTGVVVNGNRRLAGMRNLYGKSMNDHRSFSHVKCMVLPAGVTESEIVEIEIRLQMKQRTELDYEWINECVAIKELRDSGNSPFTRPIYPTDKGIAIVMALGGKWRTRQRWVRDETASSRRGTQLLQSRNFRFSEIRLTHPPTQQ